MKECKFRIPVEKTKGNDGVNEAFNKAVNPIGFVASASVGTFRQKFDCGLCELLTQNDFGPIECQQPEHNEDSCPDIVHLRTKEG